MSDYQQDRRAGIYLEVPLTHAVFALAQQYALQYSGPLRLRSLDLLHLALAKVYGASVLATFDEKLRSGAEAVGLQVFPPRP